MQTRFSPNAVSDLQELGMRKSTSMWTALAIAAFALLALAEPALAQDKPKLDSGDTAWMLTSTALVLMMTIPGLALFYGGMVRKKNVLATVMQSFAVCCMATVLWMVIGYSLAFTDGGSMNAYMGGLSKMFLAGMAVDSLSGTIPESVFMTFSNDVRDHYPGAHLRSHSGPDEVFRDAAVFGRLDRRCVRTRDALGLGRRISW